MESHGHDAQAILQMEARCHCLGDIGSVRNGLEPDWGSLVKPAGFRSLLEKGNLEHFPCADLLSYDVLNGRIGYPHVIGTKAVTPSRRCCNVLDDRLRVAVM